MEHIWNITLKKSYLNTADDKTYTACVISRHDTFHNADVADDLSSRGMGNREQILAVLNARDEFVREKLSDGNSFADSNIRLFPVVKGKWRGKGKKEKGEDMKCTVSIVCQKPLLEVLASVKLHVLGEKGLRCFLGSFIDLERDMKSEEACADDTLQFKCKDAKILDSADEEQGFFLLAEDGTERKARLVTNTPSLLTVRLPSDIAEGVYTPIVRTRYNSKGGALSSLRTIQGKYPVRIVPLL